VSQDFTYIRCVITEESIVSMCAGQMDELEQQMADADLADRMAGLLCERCQEEAKHGLRVSGGEALCDGCYEAEHEDACHVLETIYGPSRAP
jgi:hypothetical protein